MHLKHEVTAADYSPPSLRDPRIYLLSSLATYIFFSLHLADASSSFFLITQQQLGVANGIHTVPGCSKAALEVTDDGCMSYLANMMPERKGDGL